MEEDKLVYNTTELANRWECNIREISRLKAIGVIKPMPGFSTKYSLEMIKSIESTGIDGLSCVQRLKFENKIKGLQLKIEELTKKLEDAKKFIGTL